jgi:hypothetical protein
LWLKKSANDRTILYSCNETKALWNIIRDETGNGSISHQNISLEMGTILITDPQCLSYQFNDYFVDRMFVPPNDVRGVLVPVMKIPQNINSMFVTPITEELLKVVGKLRSGFSLDFDEIPASLVKHYKVYN